MNFPYILLLITFLGYPIAGYFLPRGAIVRHKRLLFGVFLFFAAYDLFRVAGFSFAGDYADYIVLSLEYMLFCMMVWWLLKSGKTGMKVAGIIGALVIVPVFLAGLIGIVFFIPLTQDMVTDRVYNYKGGDGHNYETRRFSFGFATLDNTRYTFDTYRKFSFLPIEKHIDTSTFFDNKTNLDFYDRAFDIGLTSKGRTKKIIFSSSKTKVSKAI